MGTWWSWQECAWVETGPEPDPLATPWSWAPALPRRVCPLALEALVPPPAEVVVPAPRSAPRQGQEV